MAQMNSTDLSNLRQTVNHQSYGILSTHSQSNAGYPFGSVVPYILDHTGQPVILISEIAEHTKNITNNSKVALTIVEKSGSSARVQTRGRVSFLGNAQRLSDDEKEGIKSKYLRYYPYASRYFEIHGFDFFRIQLHNIRYIGGFGKIYWVSPEDYLQDNVFDHRTQAEVLEHMNLDHQSAMRNYLTSFDIEVGPEETIDMVGVDQNGFDMLYHNEKYRIDFEDPVATAQELREILIELSKR